MWSLLKALCYLLRGSSYWKKERACAQKQTGKQTNKQTHHFLGLSNKMKWNAKGEAEVLWHSNMETRAAPLQSHLEFKQAHRADIFVAYERSQNNKENKANSSSAGLRPDTGVM